MSGLSRLCSTTRPPKARIARSKQAISVGIVQSQHGIVTRNRDHANHAQNSTVGRPATSAPCPQSHWAHMPGSGSHGRNTRRCPRRWLPMNGIDNPLPPGRFDTVGHQALLARLHIAGDSVMRAPGQPGRPPTATDHADAARLQPRRRHNAAASPTSASLNRWTQATDRDEARAGHLATHRQFH